MRVYMLRPTTPRERRETGAWWSRTLVGPHHPARGHNPHFWRLWLPEPELFDFDDIFLEKGERDRCADATALQRARTATSSCLRWSLKARAAAASAPPTSNASGPSSCLRRASTKPTTGRTLAATAQTLHFRWSSLELRTFERILGRLPPRSRRASSRFFTGEAQPKLALPTHYHFALFTHHLVSHGKSVVDEVSPGARASGTPARGLHARPRAVPVRAASLAEPGMGSAQGAVARHRTRSSERTFSRIGTRAFRARHRGRGEEAVGRSARDSNPARTLQGPGVLRRHARGLSGVRRAAERAARPSPGAPVGTGATRSLIRLAESRHFRNTAITSVPRAKNEPKKPQNSVIGARSSNAPTRIGSSSASSVSSAMRA